MHSANACIPAIAFTDTGMLFKPYTRLLPANVAAIRRKPLEAILNFFSLFVAKTT
jgi:hypothetical protein